MANTQLDGVAQLYFLETKRLLLRPFAIADTDNIVRIFADTRVSKWVDDGTPLSHDQAKRWVAASFASVEKHGTSAGAIIEKSSKRMIGWGGIVHPQDTIPEIIYGFEYAAWQNGFGKEIATAIVEDSLKTRNIPRLRATVDPQNTGSIKILRSLGFNLISSGLDEYGLPTDIYQT